MNDEIKEFNEELYVEMLENGELYDYTTNLQEKYDKALTDLVHESHKRIELENKITNLQQELQKKDAYIKYLEQRAPIQSKKIYGDGREELQERIEKAVEYIKNNTCKVPVLDYRYMDISDEEIDNLLNILNGRSDE